MCQPESLSESFLPTHVEATTVTLAFEKRKDFIAELTSKETGGSNLSPIQGSGSFKGSRLVCWWGRFCWDSVGTWSFTVRYGKGLHSVLVFLDNGPFASERVLVLKFRSCLGPFVL